MHLQQTEVKLSKSNGVKVRTIDGPSIPSTLVNLRSKEAPTLNTAEKLRAAFDESINVLRSGPQTESISTSIKFTPSLGENPIALQSYHPIIQTLLKLYWEGHKKRFLAITLTFKSALEDKLKNTQKILAQKASLKKSNDELLAIFQAESSSLAVQNFEQHWVKELDAAREKFQAPPTTTIEELLSKALEFCARINVEPAVVDVGDLLEQSDKVLKARTENLWNTWRLHVERHNHVYKGDLGKLIDIDEQIKAMDDSGSVLTSSTDSECAEGPTSETETAYKAWMEFVKLLSTLKIDYDIRINVSKKACGWIAQRIKENMHSELAQTCMEIMQIEQASILSNREKVREVLDQVKSSHATIKAELDRACNNKSAQYSNALAQMQLTCDLCLEATRETLYQHANKAIKPNGASV